MVRPQWKSAIRAGVLSAVLLLAAPTVRGQTSGAWSGSGGSGLWSNAGNWVNNTQPTNGGAVSFTTGVLNTANLSTTNDLVTSLSGISIGAIPGTAGATPVTISGNSLTLGAGGISMTGATQDLAIDTNLSLSAAQNWNFIGARTLTIGTSVGSNSLALSTSAANTLTFAPAGAGTLILNSNITDGVTASSLSFSPPAATAAIIRLLGANTYTGGTTVVGHTEILQIGSSTAFGTGTITTTAAASGSVVPQFQAFGGPQTIGNNLIVNFGFQFGGSNNLTLNGAVTIGTSRAITYNSTAGTALTFNGPVTIGTAGAAAGTLTTSVVSGTSVATGLIVFNGIVSEAAGVTSGAIVALSNGTGTTVFSTDQFNNQNTFSGGINATGASATLIAGTSSVLVGSTLMSGPFGTGAVTVANSANPIRMQAANGPQNVANNITLTNSLQVQGSLDLTLSGVLSGNGGLVKMGTNTLSLTNANTYLSTSPGTAISGGQLLANNASGSATGSSLVNVIGTGTAGSGGTLGGGNAAGTVGFINGNVNISSTTSTTQGGTLAPGSNGPGALTMTGGNMTWNPLGTYNFEHDASATGTAPIGGANTDLLKGNGTATLNLSALGNTAGQQFTLNLLPLNFPAILPTSPVTYTLADFSASAVQPAITAPAGMVGTDLTPFFVVTGNFQSAVTPIVTLNNGNQVLVTFVPVPEPGFILAACGVAFGGLTWLRRRSMTWETWDPA